MKRLNYAACLPLLCLSGLFLGLSPDLRNACASTYIHPDFICVVLQHDNSQARIQRNISQKKPDILRLIGKPISNVLSVLGVKEKVDSSKVDNNKSESVYEWRFSFSFPGADEGNAALMSKDAEGRNVYVFKIGLYFKKNIGEKNALILAGLNPNDWKRKSPGQYLSSKKFPKMLVKYNSKSGSFINFETFSENNYNWGLEIARDPYYK